MKQELVIGVDLAEGKDETVAVSCHITDDGVLIIDEIRREVNDD